MKRNPMNKKSSCALSYNPTSFFLVGAFVVIVSSHIHTPLTNLLYRMLF